MVWLVTAERKHRSNISASRCNASVAWGWGSPTQTMSQNFRWKWLNDDRLQCRPIRERQEAGQSSVQWSLFASVASSEESTCLHLSIWRACGTWAFLLLMLSRGDLWPQLYHCNDGDPFHEQCMQRASKGVGDTDLERFLWTQVKSPHV